MAPAVSNGTKDNFARWAIGLVVAMLAFLAIKVWGLPSEVPPSWFKEEVDELKYEIQALRHDVGELKVNIATINGNRFTSGDGLRLTEDQRDIWREISAIKEALKQ